MKVSDLMIPAAIMLVGGRVAYSQQFISYKYGFLFDFGPYHQTIGLAIFFIGIALAYLVSRSRRKDRS
jgi:hypothetical protein